MAAALGVWAIATLLGLAALPLAQALLAPLPGAAAGMARPLGLLLAAVPLWWLSSIGAVAYTRGSAWVAVGLLVLLGAGLVWRRRRAPRAGARWLLGGAELVFTATYVLGIVVVSHAPDLWGTERPLDMALVNAVDLTRHFPPLDPWLSGHDLNYYYLGQYLMGFVIRLAGAAPTEGYNACVALVWALGASAAFGLGGAAAAGTRRWRGTLLGATALAGLGVLGGNVLGAYKLAALDGPLRALDWFSASRAVPGTANDFPSFEAIIGDLHAHVIAVPIVFLLLAYALRVALHGTTAPAITATAGLVLGAIYPVNAWAAPAALAVVLAAGALPRPGWRAWATWAAVLVAAALVTCMPFLLSTGSGGTRGIGRVSDRQGLGDFLVDLVAVYGFALVVALAAAAAPLTARQRLTILAALVAILPLALLGDLGGPAVVAVLLASTLWRLGHADDQLERFGLLLLAVAFLCVLAPEFVYLRDAFSGGLARFNTAFKVGFDAWLLLAAAAAVLLAARARNAKAWWPLLAVVALCAASFPPAAAWVRTEGFAGPAHLDGLRWLAPGDRAAIAWLRTHAEPGDVVLEAVGPEYSSAGHGRISVFTGRPTVLAWAGHELFYHGAAAQGTRAQDVARIYRTGNRELLRRYDVRWVVVGALERATYPATRGRRFGQPAFVRAGTAVIRVAG